MGRFAGQVAVVTGGASGIGAAIVARLHAEGAIVFVADLAKGQAPGIQEHYGDSVRFIEHDVSNEQSWRSLMERVTQGGAGLDVLVNGAGIMQPGDIESTTSDMFQLAMSVNAGGVFLGCQSAIRTMREGAKPGAIVNLASTSALRPAQWTLAYAASKAAVVSLTRTIALHCARSGYPIRCNAVLPAAVLTPMVTKLLDMSPDPSAALAALVADSPIGRLVTMEEVASAVAYLASAEASAVTGSAMVVDGGLTAS